MKMAGDSCLPTGGGDQRGRSRLRVGRGSALVKAALDSKPACVSSDTSRVFPCYCDCGVVWIVGDHVSRVGAAWNSSLTARASRLNTRTGDPLVYPSPSELVCKEFRDAQNMSGSFVSMTDGYCRLTRCSGSVLKNSCSMSAALSCRGALRLCELTTVCGNSCIGN